MATAQLQETRKTNNEYKTRLEKLEKNNEIDTTRTQQKNAKKEDMDTNSPPRLSRTESEVLHLLVANDEMYGLEIAKAGGLAAGTIYVLLARMVVKGVIASFDETRGPNTRGKPRKMYRLTGLGQRVARAEAAAAAAFHLEGAPG